MFGNGEVTSSIREWRFIECRSHDVVGRAATRSHSSDSITSGCGPQIVHSYL